MANESNETLNPNKVNKKSLKTNSIKQRFGKTVQKSSAPKHPTPAFIEKSDNEFKQLKNKIAEQFRQQIFKVFESESFADTLITRGKFQKRVHSCLLKTRIPLLFNKLLELNLNSNAYNPQTKQYLVEIPPEIEEQEIKLLLQKTYSDFSSDIIKSEEKLLISKIDKTFPTEEDNNLLPSESIRDTIDLKMDSSIEYMSHSDNHSDEEPDEFKSNEFGDEDSMGIIKRNPMIRSGTFEILSSIKPEDTYYVKSNNKNTFERKSRKKSLDQNEEILQKPEEIEPKNDEITDEMNKSSNVMFSMFIDINKMQTKTEEPKEERDDRKGFDFIPLNIKPTDSQKPLGIQRKLPNLTDALFQQEVVADIPSLPMSPYLRKEPEIEVKKAINGNHLINEVLEDSPDGNLSEMESKKFDNFIDDLDNESIVSEDGNVNSDIDFNDSQTIRDLKSCSKLGEDLLKMFIQEIDSDITIRVSDREIKAHKCILTSRCRYFEAMLSGKWIESDSNYVDLQGFSYNSVYFALCHIYSGCLSLPSNIDMYELALLSDILEMDSLKEIVIHELLVNRCHFFHTPCSEKCVVNAIKCMKLCPRLGLNDLYKRCLNWTAKHFTKVWNNKTFAALKPPLLDACLQAKVKQILPENVLQTALDCERMKTAIPRVKWSEPVFTLLAGLMEETIGFIAEHFHKVITTKEFLTLGRGNALDQLEQILLSAMAKLSPDMSCKALIELNKILLLQENIEGLTDGPFKEDFWQMVTKLQRFCERFMIQNANKVIQSQNWSMLSNHSQQKIRDGALLVFEFEKPVAPPPKLTSRLKRANEYPKEDHSSNHSSPSCTPPPTKGTAPNNRFKTITNLSVPFSQSRNPVVPSPFQRRGSLPRHPSPSMSSDSPFRRSFRSVWVPRSGTPSKLTEAKPTDSSLRSSPRI